MINTFRNYALLLVVFIHAHLYIMEYAHVNVPDWLLAINYNLLGYFQPAAILAAISGYLFFKDIADDPEKWQVFLKHKYFKRIKSILLPYLFWVGFFFLFNNLLIYAIGKFKPEIFVNSFHEISISNFFKAFFYPELAVAQHLWYLNNLLFVFILAPLFPYFNKHIKIFLLLLTSIIFLYWFLISNDATQAGMILKYRFIVFFMVGSFFSYHKESFVRFLTHKTSVSIICFVTLVTMFFLNYSYPNAALMYVLNTLAVQVLIFYLVYIILVKYGSGKDALYNRSNHFLLYIIHPLLLSIMCKLLFYTGVLKVTNYLAALSLVFALSFAVVKLNTLIYHFLSRYFKRLTLHFL
jgi:peptidoglycan/LPS O-acetylase OafA/YrhL